ncbi:GNAT family N-acetyltransferase [Winogradskyella aurantiaca]|uniref:GNAT family N-acetyltransferase n=1 Tax=Winogradskyella aurantiaca TaxID=2219558 RepID=UPI000E1CA8F0|nr:GNAT family N-acetyltransferase [Winogradskyella aurantiaca]
MSPNIISFDHKYAKDFHDLNIEWLETYFYVEPYDKEVLSKPDKYIINKGGQIFFLLEKDAVLATAALMPTEDPTVLELTKMAVTPRARGEKFGQRLLQYCIDFAKSKDYAALMLYSNTILENAIHLYRKYGFKELELEKDNPYERANIKMLRKL